MRNLLSATPMRWILLAVLLGMLTPMIASAADQPGEDQWQFGAKAYLWGAGINGTTRNGGDIDVDFSTILKNLDMALMGTFEARRSRWGLGVDVIYMDVSADGSERVSVGPRGNTTIEIDADIGIKAWIPTFVGGYEVLRTETYSLALLAGVRYFWIDVDVDLNRTLEIGDRNRSRSRSSSGSDHVWDGVVGVRGSIDFDDRWYFHYYGDVGTGDSDLTWSTNLGVGYRFDWGHALLSYRYMDYDFDSDFLVKDLNLSGPVLGFQYNF